jgi:hypothetical protein
MLETYECPSGYKLKYLYNSRGNQQVHGRYRLQADFTETETLLFGSYINVFDGGLFCQAFINIKMGF